MNTVKKRKKSSFDTYAFIILIAFEFLMSFTFLGYVHIPPISVTFAYIPILIAACVLDTSSATVLGAAFGLASLYKSTAFYAMQADVLFSPFMSGNLWGSLVLSVGSRTLFGYLAGVVYGFAKRQKHKRLCVGIVSAFSPLIHGLIVMAAMAVCFPGGTGAYFHLHYLFVSNMVSAVICVVIVEFVWRLYNSKTIGAVKSAVDRSKQIPYNEYGKRRILIAVFTVFVFSMTGVATLYFSERMSNVLVVHSVAVSPKISFDLVQLQVQFMMAVLSLNVISIVVLDLSYRYTAYKNFLGELDAVTGVMGRRIFLNCCERAQKNFDRQVCSEGWFLFLDIDNFKSINDTFGHLAGDGVLREIALVLKSIFYNCGIVGRMGGDEFAVIIDKKELSQIEIEKMLDEFLDKISGALQTPYRVSCSIGACRFSFPADVSHLMNKTDTLLYEAKQKGRACYVTGSFCDDE